MRILKGPVIVSVLIMLVFSSCQKDIGDTTNGRVQSDSTLLAKTTTIITNYFPTEDTVNWSFYEYDDDKRIKQVRSYNGYGSPDYVVYNNFFYAGMNSLPNLETKVQVDLAPVTDTTGIDSVYYFYQNGKLSFDSTIEYSGSTATPNGYMAKYGYFSNHYVFSGTTVNVSLDHYLGVYFGQIKMTDIISITPAGANTIIIERKETQDQITRTARYRVTFDNNPNPYYKTVVPSPAYGLVSDFNFPVYFPNNIIELEKTFDDTYNPNAQHDKYIYTYRSDGYPLTVAYYDMVLNPAVSYYKYFFTYQH